MQAGLYVARGLVHETLLEGPELLSWWCSSLSPRDRPIDPLSLSLSRSSLEQDDFNLLNILPLHAKLKYNEGIYMQKIMSGNALPSVTRFFPINSSREHTKINIPRPRIDLFKSSLTYSGASLWNSLPLAIKSRSNYSFKKHYLSYLTSISWPQVKQTVQHNNWLTSLEYAS